MGLSGIRRGRGAFRYAGNIGADHNHRVVGFLFPVGR